MPKYQPAPGLLIVRMLRSDGMDRAEVLVVGEHKKVPGDMSLPELDVIAGDVVILCSMSRTCGRDPIDPADPQVVIIGHHEVMAKVVAP